MFIDHLYLYSCNFVSGCVGRGPRALLFPGAYNVVKTALHPLLHVLPDFVPQFVNRILQKCIWKNVQIKKNSTVKL
jgi:hypothetical protein